jgi:predicted RNase H-like HicB family nuclease
LINISNVKTTALIEKGSDGTFSIFTPDLQHTILGEGKTISDAKLDFENSVMEIFASYTENGHILPSELQGIEFEYVPNFES